MAGAAIAPTATTPLEGLVETRTPEPTATPGQIAREVEKAVARAGLAWTRILGLTIADWANLGTALLAAVLAYLASTLLIRRILPPLAQPTTSELDDQLLEQTGSHLRCLVVVITCDRAMQPLTFLSAGLKQLTGDALFVLALAIRVHGTWTAINVVARWYHRRARRADREKELAPVITLLSRLARV